MVIAKVEHYIDIRLCYNSTIPVGALSWWTKEQKKMVLVINPKIAGTRLERLTASVNAIITIAEQAHIIPYDIECNYNKNYCCPDYIKTKFPQYKIQQMGKN